MAKKTGKKQVQMLVLLAVLIISAACYAIIRNTDFAEEDEQGAVTALYVSKEELTKIGWTDASRTGLSFTKSSDGWVCDSEPDREVNTIKLDSALDAACDIKSRDVISSVKDLSLYGLSEPSLTINLELSDGTKKTIKMGDLNDMTYDYYISIDGDSNVYTVDSSFADSFGTDVSEYTEEVSTQSEAGNSGETAVDGTVSNIE